MIEALLAGAVVGFFAMLSKKNTDCHTYAATWWLYCFLGFIGIVAGQIYLHSQGVDLEQQIENEFGSRNEYPAQYRSPYQ